MTQRGRPRSPAALVGSREPPAQAPKPPPKTAEEAVEQCLSVLEKSSVTLRDGSPVTQEMLPSVVGDILGLWARAQAEAQQLRATLKSVL